MSTCGTDAGLPGRGPASLALLGVLLAAGAAAAEPEIILEMMPARYAHVDGDEENFRAQHWMKDGYAGGIKEASLSHVFKNGISLRSEGHAIVDENDMGAALSLEKEGDGFLHLDFSSFRKYYDGTGGIYYPNTFLQRVDTDRDLALDIGRFTIEGGVAPPAGYPQIGFEYEHEVKNGAKSRLTWGAVKEAGVTRKIAPSWQEIDERVDAFTLKLGQEVAGFALDAKQRWEFVRAENTRFEPLYSTTATASDKKIRRQAQGPEADLMTTTLTAERPFLSERGFFSTGYRFSRLDSREIESIFETNAAGVPTNFTNPDQKRNARADNDCDAHTWVGSLLFRLCKAWTLTTRLKAETVLRESTSLYPADNSPNSAGGSAPDGVFDEMLTSTTENRAHRTGEALQLRFTGVPRTALYAEAEAEQGRVRLSEDRKDLLGANNDTFSRLTIGDVDRETFTLGGQSSPCRRFHLTAHGRHRIYNNDYDDQRETDPTGTAARSAFLDGQRVVTDELATRLAFDLAPWLHPAVRYQLRDDDFSTRAENEQAVETGMLSHIITADVTLQLLRDLLATFSYSRQSAEVRTPARLAGPNGNTPPFHTDVDSWLASADYAVCPHLSLTGTLLYSRADNFDNFTQNGLPLGADDERVDVTAGLKWAPKEDFSVGVDYAFYRYAANPNAGSGDYAAHVVSVEGTKKF